MSPSSSIRPDGPVARHERSLRRKGFAVLRPFRGGLLGLVVAVSACQGSETHLAATKWGGADASVGDVGQEVADSSGQDGGRQDGSGQSCSTATIDLTMAKAIVVLVAERSSAMDVAPCAGCDTPWNSLVSATDTLTRTGSNQFRWGLKLFPSPGQVGVCSVSATLDVAPAPDNAAALSLAMQSAGPPVGESPATFALRQVYGYFFSLPYDTPRIVVLATGNSPTCGGAGSAQDDYAAALAVVDQSFMVFTYVLGVGPKRIGLDRLAVAGGTNTAYTAADASTLLADMERLSRVMGVCWFDMPAAPLPGQTVQVTMDSTAVSANDYEGYSLSGDGLHLLLNGSYCGYYGNYSTLTIDVGCK